jgi:hypothetical protein
MVTDLVMVTMPYPAESNAITWPPSAAGSGGRWQWTWPFVAALPFAETVHIFIGFRAVPL